LSLTGGGGATVPLTGTGVYPPSGGPISFVGAGPQLASQTEGASVVPPLPSGWEPGDFAILFVGGRPTDDATPAAPTGWTLRTESYRDFGLIDLKIVTYYRRLQTGDSDPAVVVPATWSGTSNNGGLSAAVGVWRGVDTVSPFDVTDGKSTVGTQATWQPSGLITVTPGAWVLSFVGTHDDNALGFGGSGDSQGFTLRLGGALYDTTVGADHSIGVADREIAEPGSVSMPAWNQSVNGSDHWVAITCALRPASAP
jgi:hypothetical protein